MTKLTKRFVESVEPQSKGHVVWNDELPGFGLRVYPLRLAQLHRPVPAPWPLTSLHDRPSWHMTRKSCLVANARLALEAKALREVSDCEDGCLTSRGTFQRFFEQQELRQWIDRTLEANAVPAAPGIFYVFRDELARTQFLA